VLPDDLGEDDFVEWEDWEGKEEEERGFGYFEFSVNFISRFLPVTFFFSFFYPEKQRGLVTWLGQDREADSFWRVHRPKLS